MSSPSPSLRGLFLPALVLALGVASGALVLAWPFHAYVKSRHLITVKGYAEQKVDSDFAVWSATMTTRGKLVNDAAVQMDKDTQAVTDFLIAQGVPRKAISFSVLTTTALNSTSTDGTTNTAVVDGYKIDRCVEVDSVDLDNIAKLANAAPELLRTGMEISINSVSYYCTKLSDIKVTLLGSAVEDARHRAEEIAHKSERRVGSLDSAAQGVFQITSPYESETSDEGSFDLSSREKSVKAVVTAEFELR